MDKENGSVESMKAWRSAGASDLVFRIDPIHTHTVAGLRVRITGIAPSKKTVTLLGVVLADQGEVAVEWHTDGLVRNDNLSHYQLADDGHVLLRDFEYFGAQLCPG